MGLIRIFLAYAVVLEHCPSYVGLRLFPGNMAVELFFIISGFYMQLISQKYDVLHVHGALNFYASRFWRLWPTFILTTLAIYAWWTLAYVYLGRLPAAAADFGELLGHGWAYAALLFSNVFMIGQDVPSLFHVTAEGVRLTFGPAESTDGAIWLGFVRNIGQAWSIGTEIWFYLLVPLLVRAPSAALAVVAAALLALRAYMGQKGLVTYFFFPTQLPLFLLGMLACRCPVLRTASRAGPFLIGAVVIAGFLFGTPGEVDQAFKWVLYPAFAVAVPAIFAFSKRSRTDRAIGELSYPVYITHMLVLSIASAGGKRLGLTIGGELLIVFSTATSAILYRGVDVPIGQWRQRFSERKEPGH